MQKKTFRFFFHYNKPATQKEGKPMVTLHYKKQCHIIPADKFIVLASCEGKANKKQPRFVMQGMANRVFHIKGVTTVL